MKSFRFIHTGDIHLDSPLKGLSGQQCAAAERIRTATRVALDRKRGRGRPPTDPTIKDKGWDGAVRQNPPF